MSTVLLREINTLVINC